MSKQAVRHTTRATRIANEFDAEYDLGSNINTIAAEARREMHFLGRPSDLTSFVCPITKGKYYKPDRATIDWRHLRERVEETGKKAGFSLPHNLGNMVNAGVAPGRYPRFASKAGAAEVAQKVSRFCGWLKAAKDLPALARVITRSQSHRGVFSRATRIGLWALAARNPSPGTLERKLWKVRARAEGILAAYSGDVKVPAWWAVAHGTEISPHVGKAALVAVASTLSGETYNNYRAARKFLLDYHLCSVDDTSDGVAARREVVPCFAKLSVKVYRAMLPKLSPKGRKVGIEFGYLVCSPDGRTYHDNSMAWLLGPRLALKMAVNAWRRQDEARRHQDELAKEKADFHGLLKGERGFMPLVVHEDSQAAGNCRLGTDSWLSARGWSGRWYVPAAWLVPHLGDRRVANVAEIVRRRHTS